MFAQISAATVPTRRKADSSCSFLNCRLKADFSIACSLMASSFIFLWHFATPSIFLVFGRSTQVFHQFLATYNEHTTIRPCQILTPPRSQGLSVSWRPPKAQAASSSILGKSPIYFLSGTMGGTAAKIWSRQQGFGKKTIGAPLPKAVPPNGGSWLWSRGNLFGYNPIAIPDDSRRRHNQ